MTTRHQFQGRSQVEGEPGVCGPRALARLYASPGFRAGARAVRDALALEEARAAGRGRLRAEGTLEGVAGVPGSHR